MIRIGPANRAAVIDRIVSTIEGRFYDPALAGVDIRSRFAEQREQLRNAEDFERAVNEVLKTVPTSHMGLFHESTRNVAGKMALSATFAAVETPGGFRWAFQDVHVGGPAHAAGLQPGDVLLRVAGKEVIPSELPVFPLGESVELDVEKRDGQRPRVSVQIPASKSKQRPLVVMEPVTACRLNGSLGYVKVAMFPGIIGIDVARSITRAIQDLGCDALIADLRGNTGGGLGCLRLMSLLTAAKVPIGYSITRAKMAATVDPATLPVFDRIPSSKLGLFSLVPRFALRDKSVALRTEGLGPQRFHGRVAILMNEHSASSSEMVLAFAAENRLAALVGTKSPGRLLGATSFKVGHGFRLALPVVAYRTWSGASLEGKGVVPDVNCPFSWEAARNGSDPQFDAARDALK